MRNNTTISDIHTEQKERLAKFCSTVPFTGKLQDKLDKYSDKYGNSKNKIIRHLMLFCIKALFKSGYSGRSIFKDNICHLLLVPGGGIGDHFHFLKYCYCLKQKFKNTISIDILLRKEDVFLKDTLYSAIDFIDDVFTYTAPHHDVEISVVRFQKTEFIDIDRIFSLNNSELIIYLDKITDFELKHRELFKSDYLGRCYTLIFGKKRENQPDVQGLLNMESVTDFSVKVKCADRSKVLDKFGLQKNNFIVLQTGSGFHFQKVKDETRQWPVEYYAQLAKLLKEKFPGKRIVQCGVKEQNRIENTDLCLLGKTSFDELLVLLSEAYLLISQEGGYPITRHYISRKPSCVLFGPTDINFFGFDENINLSSETCPGCEWINKHWYKKCLLTGETAKCMQKLTPEMVAKEIERQGISNE